MKTIAHSLIYGVNRYCWITLPLVMAFSLQLMVSLSARADVANLYTGTSNYTIPIVTPSGTNGVGPHLSLAYANDGGNSWLGVGWSLAGLGSIERLGTTYSPSPTYTASDTYLLNLGGSAKLIYAGVDPAGNSGNYFRTEIESFQRIEYVNASNSWVVTDKNGVKYFFGQTAASQQNNPNNATQVFSWKLDMVLDTHGIFWTVSYDKDAVNGDMYPKQIVYSQGPGLTCTPSNLTACRTVDFTLEPRSFLATGSALPVSYHTGAKIVSDQLLQRIDVKLGGQPVQAYVNHYLSEGNSPDAPSGVGPRGTARAVHLTAVEDLAADGTPLRYAFTYHKNPYDTTTNATATTLIKTSVAGTPMEGLGGVPQNPPTASNCTYVMDMNNDGRDDVLVGQTLSAGGWYYYPSLGGGAFGPRVNIVSPATALPSLCTATTDYQRYQTGWRYVFEYGVMWAYANNPNVVRFDPQLCMDGCKSWDNVYGLFTLIEPDWGTREIITPVRDTTVMDIDGDGIPDILYSPGVGQWFWWKGVAGGQFAERATINLNSVAPQIQLNDLDVRLVDMNSDGLPDLVKMVYIQGTCAHAASTWRVDVYRNLGRDASGILRFSATVMSSSNLAIHVDDPDATPVPCTTGVPTMPSNGFAFIDINSDGLPDLVWFVRGLTSTDWPEGVRRVYYYPNQGPLGTANWSFAPKANIGGNLQTSYAIMAQVDRWTDMNGDGRPDLLIGIGQNLKLPAGLYGYFSLEYPSALYPDGHFGAWTQLQNYPTSFLSRDFYTTLADLNGDGVSGILVGNPGGSLGSYVYYSQNHSSNHDFLESATNPMGGATTFTYNKLLSANTNRWVTSSVSQNDGVGVNASTYYYYSGGKKVGWPNNEFRGYSQVAAMDPAGHYNITYFHQDDIKKGRVNYSQIHRSISEGFALMTQTTNSYDTSTPIAGVSRVDLTAQQIDTYDGGASYKSVRTDYASFDAYGNARYAFLSGTGITPRVTTTDFAYNTGAYIVNRPSHTINQMTSVAGTKINESWFDYDYQANGVAPSKGDVTKETRWLSGGTNPIFQYAYDSAGNRIGTLDAKGNTCATTGYTSKVSYDTTYSTFVIAETNALCQTTSKTYWGINTSLDATVAFAYPFPGALATATDQNGVRSDSYWDSRGRTYKFVVPPDTVDLPTKQISYTTSSVPNAISQYTMGPSTYTYVDGFGRTIQVKSTAEVTGQRVTQDTWYNSSGLVESVTVPYLTSSSGYTPRNISQYKTTTLYDAIQRPVKVTNPDNTYRTNIYTPFVVASTDENFFTTTRTYDALNRLISVIEPTGGGTTTYYYDFFNTNGTNMQWITNAQSNYIVSIFDTLGRKTTQSDPDLGAWSYTYDANGNLLTQTDAKAQVLAYAYDKLNRITTKTYPSSGGVITYYYDDPTGATFRKGRLWRVADLSGTTTFTYDLRGRQTQVDKSIVFNTYTTRYSYDSLDRVTYMFYPNNEIVGFTYNAQGLLDSVNNFWGGAYVSNLDYNALGQVTSKTVGNGKVTTYDYYPDSQRLHNLATPGVQNLTYSYDNAGNISGISSTVQAMGNQTFGYDSLNRLTSASSPTAGPTAPGYSHSYGYDAIGNLKSGDGKTFTYPAPGAVRPHAPTSDGTCSYLYDANGNTSSRTCGASVRTYTWDYDNRLSQLKDGSAVLETATYDYTGQRMLKTEGGTMTFTPFPHYRVVGTTATKYYFANGQRIAERDSTGAIFYYHPDHLGSTNSVTDSSGTEVRAEISYPYGRDRAAGGTKLVAHGYTGQERDTVTGLYYYGARYYDPVGMRFISPDSTIPDVADPQTLNRYAYARGNPVRYIDPKGRSSIPFDWNSTLLTSGNSTQFSFNTSYDSGSFGNYGASFSALGAGSFAGASYSSSYSNNNTPTLATTFLEYAGNGVDALGLAAGATELKYVNNTSWLADNGKRYSFSARGNQSYGGWSQAHAMSDSARNFGTGTFILSSGISLYQGWSAYNEGDNLGLVTSGLNLTVGTASFAIGGELGFAIGFGYSGLGAILYSAPLN